MAFIVFGVERYLSYINVARRTIEELVDGGRVGEVRGRRRVVR